MIKSGLIVGAGMFICVLLAAVISPLCALCVAIFAGLGAGYLTGVFEKPQSSPEVIRRGAGAGAIAGGMAILAQILAAVINAAILQNPQYQVWRTFGLPLQASTSILAEQLLAGACIGILNVGIAAGLGAGGGAIWYSTAGKKGPLAQTPLT
ncbi:MAG: hypothetical protein ABSB41_03840 [Anaerolineales bacterium]|jgi:hypothetical protein